MSSSNSSSSQPKRLGRRVFPNQDSVEIRKSQQFLHYVPPPEPPIDYTIRVPQEKDYKVIGDVFHRPSSVDYSKEEAHLTSSSKGTPQLGGRRNTVEEVLDELDTVLFEASIPFDELKKKVERFNLTFKPYAPEITVDDLPEIPYSTDIKRIPKLDAKPTRETIQEERNRLEIERTYRKTLETIETAKEHYSPQYFRDQFEQEGIPHWKRNLLAEKKSKEAIRRIEHDAWLEYERIKQRLSTKPQIKRSSSVQLRGPRTKSES
ncbi:Protein CBG02614 [Caenorhabditis briggsae]|uniref:Uncharacterized protein n=2 Tax=Caenorhabditis briggsae TaxID=6238 RepID=A0AAE9DK72_CAEBR|nr:Protein CBG02614 [Caenorhabditis briggsae]ULU06601.1 hypothetical protein L3Y34_018440 [Caenorhabditis briggsae]CAP23933.1 Protein CBG02614 [Caenorhabditis briggsae]